MAQANQAIPATTPLTYAQQVNSKYSNNASIFVTPKTSAVLPGGFSGWTSSFRYMPYASNPQEAYNIYKDGFGGSILANAMSKYRFRFSLIKDNKESGGFEI